MISYTEMRKFIITLQHIEHTGDPIGREISVEGIAGGVHFTVAERRIAKYTVATYDQQVAVVTLEEGVSEIPMRVIVSERDFVWSDTGSVEKTILVDTDQERQTFSLSVPVTERWWFFLKRTAVFIVTFEITHADSDVDLTVLKKYTYRGVSGDEDYNQYDDIIIQAVLYWNNQFRNDTDPPETPLDPNLVKAMLYQESRVGNDPRNNGLVNIMQVGNDGDPSFPALRGEQKEYWVHNAELIALHYDAKNDSPYNSVFWGVRWLYHKAHENIRHSDGRWGNVWHPWKDAVDYYGPRDPKYIENVWNIYKNGIVNKDGEVKLWSFSGLLLAVVFSAFGWFGVSDEDIQHSFATHFDFRSAAYREEIEVIRDEHSPFILAYESDDKNWSEWVGLGFVKVNKIEWLDDYDLNSQLANGILSARFVKLAGFPESVLEVFDTTHMGNGSIHLYSLNQNTRQIRPIFEACAVDNYHDHIWNPDGYPELGGDWKGDCSVYYKNGRLQSQYKDVNNDGVDDVILTGTQQIFCSRNGHDADELVKEKDIYEEYILQPGQYQNPKQCVSMNNFFSL